jgi:hypothetical protein
MQLFLEPLMSIKPLGHPTRSSIMNKRRWILLAAVVLISLGVQLKLVHAHYWWENVPLFWGMYGFIGCTVIIFLSKWFGKCVAQRPPGYYGKEDSD